MDGRPVMRHIVLLGPMRSGKTTIGERVAAALGVPFADSDGLIAAATGTSAADIAALRGVAALHRVERHALETALSASEQTVIAAAASVVDEASCRKALAEHICVWVDSDAVTRSRRGGEGTHRRAIEPAEERSLDEGRRPHLEALCSVRVDAAEMMPDECVAVILSTLGDFG